MHYYYSYKRFASEDRNGGFVKNFYNQAGGDPAKYVGSAYINVV